MLGDRYEVELWSSQPELMNSEVCVRKKLGIGKLFRPGPSIVKQNNTLLSQKRFDCGKIGSNMVPRVIGINEDQVETSYIARGSILLCRSKKSCNVGSPGR